MNAPRLLVLALALPLVAACGSGGNGGSGGGHATVWVTHDRGAHVVVARSVPAGLTAMQALERVAKVETAYGGRFVRSIDGVATATHRDWFYYVNGYLADSGAADYRLHPGDVEWWDYRRWTNPAQDPVVVGAFPEPFVHGYDGHRRPAVVVGAPTEDTRRVARLVHAQRIVERIGEAPRGANVLAVFPATATRFRAQSATATAGAPVVMTFWGDVGELARRPRLARFHYSLP